MIHDSILDTIGNTPIIRIQRLAPAGVTMYVNALTLRFIPKGVTTISISA